MITLYAILLSMNIYWISLINKKLFDLDNL